MEIKKCKELWINKKTSVSWRLKICVFIEAEIESDGNIFGGLMRTGILKKLKSTNRFSLEGNII